MSTENPAATGGDGADGRVSGDSGRVKDANVTMANVIALIPVDLNRSRLGLASLVSRPLADDTVLAQTIARVAQVQAVQRIVLVHPPGQDPLAVLAGRTFARPVVRFADQRGVTDARRAQRIASRSWSLGAWRGGLGGATCFDELLPAAPLLAAMQSQNAEAALLVGADWPLVDPALCDQVLALHLTNAEGYKFTFTQAPPGLAGAAVARDLVSQLAEHEATFGQVLAYNPVKPQADPIGRDVCVQIDSAVRSCACRFIYDTPRAAGMLDAVADVLGPRLAGAGAVAVTATAAGLCDVARFPQHVTIELTPQRPINGPIAPQHHVRIERPAMSLDLAQRVIEQAAAEPDVALTFGGLGDALLHPHWQRLVTAAREAGALAVAIDTDLTCDEATVDQLLESPIDVLNVRLNADTAKAYETVCGRDDFSRVIANLERLINGRNRRVGDDRVGMPWIVPRLVKTAGTLADMETFFDRWMHFTGHAVIEPAPDGCGVMPSAVTGAMPRPRRRPCRQAGGVRLAGGSMLIHSDGRVPYCDEDWLGRSTAGDLNESTLPAVWRAMQPDEERDTDAMTLCGACRQWYGEQLFAVSC